jgi:uncharacterized repeat protein (TIGR02059 family)
MISLKKSLISLICIVLSSLVSANIYYVSSSGNDAANGLSESTSWNSISKVNSSFSIFKPGDQILFKRGDVFYGTITVTSSGSAGNPILLGAYGSGDAPAISGFTTISGWTNEGNGIYSKPLLAASAPNMVIIDGVNTPMGRYPDTNVGWRTIQTANGSSSITGSATDLPSSPDWNGGEVVIRKNHWIIDRNTITSHSNQTINYTNASGYSGLAGYGYFIQNHLSTLTSFGEWYYNSSTSTFYMYFGAVNPNTKVVKVSTLNQGVNIETKNNITLQNLTIQGANKAGVYISSSNYVTIQDCNILYSGSRAIFGYYGTSTNLNILNNVITDSQNDGISLSSGFTGATISGNIISNISLIAGMGGNGDGQGSGIVAWGSPSHIIQYNSLTNLGYNGITIGGNNVIVRNNFVNNFGLVKDDAGGIYEASDAAANSVLWVGQKIYNNIVLNGIGAPSGTPVNFGFTEGIYLDLRNTDILVQGNTVYNCNMGLFLHNCHEINIVDNTFYANRESQFQSYHDNYGPNDPARNLNIQRNIMISRDVTGPNGHPVTAVWIQSNANDADILLYGTSDYNYYTRPINETSNTNITITCVSGNACVKRSLEEWKNYTGQDAHSLRSAVSVNDANKIRFEYNASKSNKVVSLDGNYVDVKGAKYSGSLTLLPYTSVVLMVDPNPSTLPASPVFVSSSVQNTTPTTLEMIYDLVLTNIIPAAIAFTVIVNSTARPVNKVDISGTKVTLTLASPVIKGDVVTVSYTKPANNPLQTAAGGQAATIGAQVVTNNVSNPATIGYINSAVGNSSPTLLEINFNLTLANVLPAVSTFSVLVNSVARNVNSVSISGNSIVLTLSTAVVYGDVITVAYTKPATNPIQSTSGLQAPTMSTQSVTNKVDPVSPVYVSSAVENLTPSVLEITYNETLDLSVPSTSAFIVMVNGVKREVALVSILGNKVLLTLSSPVVYGDNITVSYIKPSINELKKATGETAASFSTPQPVTNKLSKIAIKKGDISVYPNPAREYVNISILEASLEPQTLRIFDLSGKLCLESQLNAGTNNKILTDIKSGIYIVHVLSGSVIKFVQKLIII